jgi:hypothetical protein
MFSDFHSGVAGDSVLLEYGAASLRNQTVSWVTKGNTKKEAKARKQEQKLWEDRDKWRDEPHAVEMYGGGGRDLWWK